MEKFPVLNIYFVRLGPPLMSKTRSGRNYNTPKLDKMTFADMTPDEYLTKLVSKEEDPEGKIDQVLQSLPLPMRNSILKINLLPLQYKDRIDYLQSLVQIGEVGLSLGKKDQPQAPPTPTHFHVKLSENINFKGDTTESVEKFVRNMETQKELAGISFDQLCALINRHLKGKALEWYLNLPPHIVRSWRATKDALVRKFGQATKRDEIVDMIHNTKQKEGEKVNEYADRLFNLCQICEYSEAQRKDFFIHGLRHKIKLHVRDRMPPTYDEALRLAECYERLHMGESDKLDNLEGIVTNIVRDSICAFKAGFSNAQQASQPPTPSPPTTQSPSTNQIDQLASVLSQTLLTQQQQMSQMRDHTNKPDPNILAILAAQVQTHQQASNPHTNGQNNGASGSRTVICYLCKKPGHVKSECRANRGRQGNPHSTKHCTHCDMRGHTIDDCSWKRRNLDCPTCDICNKKGHYTDKCRSVN